MFKRYNVVAERDLPDAGERLLAFLATETSVAPDRPTAAPPRMTNADGVHAKLHGQHTVQ
jgi:hypothetical protein